MFPTAENEARGRKRKLKDRSNRPQKLRVEKLLNWNIPAARTLKHIAEKIAPAIAASTNGKSETNLPPSRMIKVLYPAAGSNKSYGKLNLSASDRKSAPSSAYILVNTKGNLIPQTISNSDRNIGILSQKYLLKAEPNFDTSEFSFTIGFSTLIFAFWGNR